MNLVGGYRDAFGISVLSFVFERQSKTFET